MALLRIPVALVRIPAASGVYQMRPAFLGWQYRLRPYGEEWGPWGFLFGTERHCRTGLESALEVAAGYGQRFTWVEVSDADA